MSNNERAYGLPVFPQMPRIKTERLLLRPMCLYDAKTHRKLANDAIVSDTLDMQYPYEEGVSEDWIIGHPEGWVERGELFLLITNNKNREAMGSTSLFIDVRHQKAEFGYWLGSQFWGKGYATEAAEGLLGFCFNELGLHRMEGYHLARNLRSGRVLEKLGFTREGILRKSFNKHGVYEDMAINGLLRSEYFEQRKNKQ